MIIINKNHIAFRTFKPERSMHVSRLEPKDMIKNNLGMIKNVYTGEMLTEM